MPAMMRVVRAAVLLSLLPVFAAQADDLRVMKLEQDVRNLERTVQELSRQIGDLKLQLAMARGELRPGALPRVRATTWLDSSNWARVRFGMSESEVVQILGPPTSAREEKSARVLFYAMEIGNDGILGGSVTFRDGRVAEVAVPQLR